jgi:hypothetical protein
MNSEVRRKLDMGARVREFASAHAPAEPGYAPFITRLDELLTRADQIMSRQHQGRVGARAARSKRRELRGVLHAQLVHCLVAVGAVATKLQGDLAARFRLPSTNLTNTAFVTAVKALIAAGEGQKDLLVKGGMSPTLLDELKQAVADFVAENEAARTARRDHIEARTELDLITVQLAEQIKVLDGMTRYRFGSDPEVMAGWQAARHLLGVPRNVDAPLVTPTPAPQPTTPVGEVKHAA